jgi:hypothetical protein
MVEAPHYAARSDFVSPVFRPYRQKQYLSPLLSRSWAHECVEVLFQPLVGHLGHLFYFL